MSVTLTDEIDLKTEFGKFHARHITVDDDAGDTVREGVIVLPLTQPDKTQPLLVRIQSSCLFSESFRATDCDCALQLHESLRRIAERGGLVLYFYEEGRGAGLRKKFKAIRLQQHQKMDTLSAFKSLNITPDMRSYEAASEVLKAALPSGLAMTLLTNNPSKRDGLTEHGLNIVNTEPLVCGLENESVRQYLEEKRRLLGHEIVL